MAHSEYEMKNHPLVLLRQLQTSRRVGGGAGIAVDPSSFAGSLHIRQMNEDGSVVVSGGALGKSSDMRVRAGLAVLNGGGQHAPARPAALEPAAVSPRRIHAPLADESPAAVAERLYSTVRSLVLSTPEASSIALSSVVTHFQHAERQQLNKAVRGFGCKNLTHFMRVHLKDELALHEGSNRQVYVSLAPLARGGFDLSQQLRGASFCPPCGDSESPSRSVLASSFPALMEQLQPSCRASPCPHLPLPVVDSAIGYDASTPVAVGASIEQWLSQMPTREVSPTDVAPREWTQEPPSEGMKAPRARRRLDLQLPATASRKGPAPAPALGDSFTGDLETLWLDEPTLSPPPSSPAPLHDLLYPSASTFPPEASEAWWGSADDVAPLEARCWRRRLAETRRPIKDFPEASSAFSPPPPVGQTPEHAPRRRLSCCASLTCSDGSSAPGARPYSSELWE